ncbi:MAG: hypothetical protein ABIG20_00390 [archaeon]
MAQRDIDGEIGLVEVEYELKQIPKNILKQIDETLDELGIQKTNLTFFLAARSLTFWNRIDLDTMAAECQRLKPRWGKYKIARVLGKNPESVSFSLWSIKKNSKDWPGIPILSHLEKRKPELPTGPETKKYAELAEKRWGQVTQKTIIAEILRENPRRRIPEIQAILGYVPTQTGSGRKIIKEMVAESSKWPGIIFITTHDREEMGRETQKEAFDAIKEKRKLLIAYVCRKEQIEVQVEVIRRVDKIRIQDVRRILRDCEIPTKELQRIRRIEKTMLIYLIREMLDEQERTAKNKLQENRLWGGIEFPEIGDKLKDLTRAEMNRKGLVWEGKVPDGYWSHPKNRERFIVWFTATTGIRPGLSKGRYLKIDETGVERIALREIKKIKDFNRYKEKRRGDTRRKYKDLYDEWNFLLSKRLFQLLKFIVDRMGYKNILTAGDVSRVLTKDVKYREKAHGGQEFDKEFMELVKLELLVPAVDNKGRTISNSYRISPDVRTPCIVWGGSEQIEKVLGER